MGLKKGMKKVQRIKTSGSIPFLTKPGPQKEVFTLSQKSFQVGIKVSSVSKNWVKWPLSKQEEDVMQKHYE
jgi:hypothetical protein